MRAVTADMKQILIASAMLLPTWSAASAQDKEDLRVRVGVGAQVRPEFIGAHSTEVAPLWRLNIARGTDPFKFNAPDYSPGLPLFSSGGFSVGPAANIASGRREFGPRRAGGESQNDHRGGRFRELPTEQTRSTFAPRLSRVLAATRGSSALSARIKSGAMATATYSRSVRESCFPIAAMSGPTSGSARRPLWLRACRPIGRAEAYTVSPPRAASRTSSTRAGACSDTADTKDWSATPPSRRSCGSLDRATSCRADWG